MGVDFPKISLEIIIFFRTIEKKLHRKSPKCTNLKIFGVSLFASLIHGFRNLSTLPAPRTSACRQRTQPCCSCWGTAWTWLLCWSWLLQTDFRFIFLVLIHSLKEFELDRSISNIYILTSIKAHYCYSSIRYQCKHYTALHRFGTLLHYAYFHSVCHGRIGLYWLESIHICHVQMCII